MTLLSVITENDSPYRAIDLNENKTSVVLLSTTNWSFPSSSTRINSCAVAVTDLQYRLKGVQGGEQKWSTPCSGRNWQDRTVDRYFQELILWVQFLYLLYLIISKSTKILYGDNCFSWLAETFWKNMFLIACIPPSWKSHICWPSPLPLRSSFLELTEVLSPELQSSFCPK